MDNKVIIQDVTLAATINSYLKKDNVHNFTFTEDELKSYFSTTKELVINSRSAFDKYSEFFKYYSSLEKIQINLTGHSYEDDKFNLSICSFNENSLLGKSFSPSHTKE